MRGAKRRGNLGGISVAQARSPRFARDDSVLCSSVGHTPPGPTVSPSALQSLDLQSGAAIRSSQSNPNLSGHKAFEQRANALPAPPLEKRIILRGRGIAEEDLRIRGIPVDLSVSRDPNVETTTAQVNGESWAEIRGNRGILIPWETLLGSPDGLTIAITQPAEIQETLAPPFPLPENVLQPMEAPPRIQPTQEEIAFMENQHKNDRELRYSHAPMPVVKPPVRDK